MHLKHRNVVFSVDFVARGVLGVTLALAQHSSISPRTNAGAYIVSVERCLVPETLHTPLTEPQLLAMPKLLWKWREIPETTTVNQRHTALIHSVICFARLLLLASTIH